MELKPSFIVDENGDKESVILSFKEYSDILDELEELEAIKAYDKAKASNEKSLDFQDVIRNIEIK